MVVIGHRWCMSQVVRIRRISFRGVPTYLGEHRGTPLYSGNPQKVADWLCDGFRARFNQHRSNRCQYVYDNGERVLDADGTPLLKPIGTSVVTVTNAEARQQFPHLSAMPSLVLQAPEKLENTEWFAAAKRRKQRGGDMPGFRSRKRGDRRFSCWYNGGRNAQLHPTGRRSGMLVVSGQNPSGAERKGRWQLRFHVYLSQDIRPYTCVQVDLSRNQVTFTSPPPPVDRTNASGSLGIDRGAVHAAVTSDGEFFDTLETPLLDKRIRNLQKAMARSRCLAEKQRRDWRNSRRYQQTRRRCAKLQSQRASAKNDAVHVFTTRLAEQYETVVLEDLKTQAMTAAPKKGSKAKRSKTTLNRKIRDARWATMKSQLQYKTGGNAVVVNPAYTSQRCFACGHIERKNRESQAVFRCLECDHHANADLNAARNVLAKHQQVWTTPAPSKGKTKSSPDGEAPAMKRKPPALSRC